jgi:hypothetical protein
MFVLVMSFQPRLMFVFKAKSILMSGAPVSPSGRLRFTRNIGIIKNCPTLTNALAYCTKT